MRNGTLLTDQFFNSLESSAREVNSAETLPPACYTEPEFYKFEKEAIFCREWLCVGRVSWAKDPGDYFTTMHAGEPIIIVRNREGVLKAMSSVCQHRAALVADGRGNARALRCAYHHWTYSLDGELIGAPAMDRACNFDKKNIRLPEFRLEVWNGFIFVNLDPNAAPLGPRLRAVTEVLKNYNLAEADELGEIPEPKSEPWNWKVRFENSNDGYHANRLHAGPMHDICPSDFSIFPDLPSDTAGYFRYNTTVHPDASFNVTLKVLLPVFPNLTEVDRSRFLFLCIPPTLTMFARPDILTFNIFRAEGPDQISSQRTWLVAPGAMKMPLFEERLSANIDAAMHIFQQDRVIDRLVQIGLHSKYSIRGRYSWQEQSQRELNGWLVPRYQDYWNKMKSDNTH